jgi:hypothetical protein
MTTDGDMIWIPESLGVENVFTVGHRFVSFDWMGSSPKFLYYLLVRRWRLDLHENTGARKCQLIFTQVLSVRLYTGKNAKLPPLGAVALRRKYFQEGISLSAENLIKIGLIFQPITL